MATYKELVIRKTTLEEARDAQCKYCRRGSKPCLQSYCSATAICRMIEETEKELQSI